MPTRLINVGKGRQEVRLLCGDQSIEPAPYVALSYCWGNKVPFTTTKATLHERKDGICWDQLPATFQDAIIVTQRLGYQYLWIDALCIVQDDPDDWACESTKMGQIYSGSVLTISAKSSANSAIGFLLRRDQDGVLSCPLPVDNTAGGSSRNANCLHLSWPLATGGEDFVGQRAWTLQELLLAPRVVQYGFSKTCGERQMTWECQDRQLLEGEEMPEDDIRPDHTKGLLYEVDYRHIKLQQNPSSWTWPGQHIYRVWRSIVCEYMKRSLTFESDKFAAIAGIAAEVQKRNHDQYVTGLWKNHIVSDLLWLPTYNALLEPSPLHAPSWSWASVRGLISFQELLFEHVWLDHGVQHKDPTGMHDPADRKQCLPTKEAASESLPQKMHKLSNTVGTASVGEHVVHLSGQDLTEQITSNAEGTPAAFQNSENAMDRQFIEDQTRPRPSGFWASYTLEPVQLQRASQEPDFLGVDGNIKLVVKGYLKQINLYVFNGQYVFGTFQAPSNAALFDSQTQGELLLEIVRLVRDCDIPAYTFQAFGKVALFLQKLRTLLQEILYDFDPCSGGRQGLHELDDFLVSHSERNSAQLEAIELTWRSLECLEFTEAVFSGPWFDPQSSPEEADYFTYSYNMVRPSVKDDLHEHLTAWSESMSDTVTALVDGARKDTPGTKQLRTGEPELFDQFKCVLKNYARYYIMLCDEVVTTASLDEAGLKDLAGKELLTDEEMSALRFMSKYTRRRKKLLGLSTCESSNATENWQLVKDNSDNSDCDPMTTYCELVNKAQEVYHQFWLSRCRILKPEHARTLFATCSDNIFGRTLGKIRFDAGEQGNLDSPVWVLEILQGKHNSYTAGQARAHGLALVAAEEEGHFRRVGTYEAEEWDARFSDGMEKSILTLV